MEISPMNGTVTAPSAIEAAHRYVDAWNRRDPEAIAATFIDGGTYEDPTSGGRLTGQAIADYARRLFEMIPDLSFDVVSSSAVDDGRVATQWIMKGTNTGPLPGGPGLGRTIAVPGADFIEVVDGKIRSVTGYFDQGTMFRELGLAVNPMPADPIGPISFGGGIYVHAGKRTKPGAFSITTLNVRSQDEIQQVRDATLQISMEMLAMPAFIGFIGVVFGQRMFTITAWEDDSGPRQLMRSKAHTGAAKRLLREGFTLGGMLGVWKPDHIRMMMRCETCGEVSNAEQGATCSAGHPLPEAHIYF